MTRKRLMALLVFLMLACTAIPGMAEEGRELIGNFYTSGLPIVKEPVTFNIVVPYNGYCLIDWNDKEFYKTLAKETNVHLNFTVINDWDTQVNLMLASGDLPDAFMYNIKSLEDNLDYFQDLAKLIDLYAPSLTEAFAEQPAMVAGMKSADGSIRGLNNYYGSPDNYTGTIYWINQNWLDAVGKEMPATVDELYDVLVAFRDGDPNGNGQKDEIPLSFCQVQWAGKISHLFGLHGVLYNTDYYVQVDDDHNVFFQPGQEEFYNALEWLNKLYTEGLLDGEGFSQTNDQYTAKISQNILGICARYDPANFLDGYMPLTPLSNGDVKVLMEGTQELSGNLGLTITTKCEQPEVLVRYYDYINSNFTLKMSNRFAEEGVYWAYAEDGYNFTMKDYESTPPEGYEFWDQYIYTVGSPGSTGFAFFSRADMERDVSPKTARLAAIDSYIPYFPANPYGKAAIDESLTSELSLLYVEVDAYVQNFVASSVLEGIDETKWENHLKTLDALNISRYVELRQTAYDNYLASIQ